MGQAEELQARLEAAYALADKDSSRGGMGYLRHVVIDSKPDPLPFRLLAKPWQWDRARRIVPALDHIAGLNPGYKGPRSYCDVMPRGYDKSSFMGRMCNHLLAYSKRKHQIVIAAGDEEQAELVTEAMRTEADLNPWLSARLKFTRKRITGPGGEAKVAAADAPTSYGMRGSLYLLDEFTHWQSDAFWTSLLSGRAKIPDALFIILCNAGLKNTWQHEVIQAIQNDPTWAYYSAPEGIRLETWMSEEQIEQDSKLLPPAEARRLYYNVWIDPAEASGYLTRAEVQACVDPSLMQTFKGRNGLYYWLSVDYGPKRDRTTCGVYHQEPSGRLVIDSLDCWQGSPDAPVKIGRIREWIDAKRAAYPDLSLVCDPYQLEDLCQEYEQRMPVKRFEARGGKSNYEMAAKLRSVIVNRQLTWYPGAGTISLPNGRPDTLEDELCSLVLKPMTYGYRFDHELTRHDDRAVNMGMAVVCMLEQMRPPSWVGPEQVVIPEPDKPRHQSVVEYLQALRGGTRRLIYGIDPKQHGRKR